MLRAEIASYQEEIGTELKSHLTEQEQAEIEELNSEIPRLQKLYHERCSERNNVT
jgi:hypothetical protein